jgi:hypothetical protein
MKCLGLFSCGEEDVPDRSSAIGATRSWKKLEEAGTSGGTWEYNDVTKPKTEIQAKIDR